MKGRTAVGLLIILFMLGRICNTSVHYDYAPHYRNKRQVWGASCTKINGRCRKLYLPFRNKRDARSFTCEMLEYSCVQVYLVSDIDFDYDNEYY